MPQSTPLEKIDSPEDAPSDEERVKRIIQEMNNTNEGPGPSPGNNDQGPPQYVPEQYQQQGGPQYQQGPPQYQPMPMQGGPQYMERQGHSQEQRHVEEPEPVKEEPVIVKKNIWAHITDALKLPFVVSIVFFLLSLPIVDVYIAKYASWAFSSGGTLTMAGIAVKALVAGSVMGIYDTIDKAVSRLF
jgi:hypothetical protein